MCVPHSSKTPWEFFAPHEICFLATSLTNMLATDGAMTILLLEWASLYLERQSLYWELRLGPVLTMSLRCSCCLVEALGVLDCPSANVIARTETWHHLGHVTHVCGACKSNTLWCCYNAVSFLQVSHNKHLIARLLGRGMGCLLWVSRLIHVLLLS